LRGLVLRVGRGRRRREGRGEGGKGRGRGGLSGNVAEEAFCLKSAPVHDELPTVRQI